MNDDLPPLPEPFDYCYEWDGPFGTRKFSVSSYNGRGPDRSVPLYTADQLRAAVLAERERCAKVCESDPDAVFAAIWKSLVIPGEFDAMDETDKNRWRGVIMQAIGFTAELKAAAIRKDAP